MKTEKELEDDVLMHTRAIWDSNSPYITFTRGRCSDCHEEYSRCLPNMLDLSILCPGCWALRRLRELKERNGPKLDVSDFART